MSEKLFFLISIALLLGPSLSAQAFPIDINNPSFEWSDDVNLVTCHREMGDVLSWSAGGTGPSGVDVNCGWELACEDCCDGVVFPDGNVVCWLDTGASVYQVTDEDIVPGHAYTVTGTLASDDGEANVVLFCPWDSNTPDTNHTELVGRTLDLPLVYDPCGVLMDWHYDVKLQFVAEQGQAYLGKKLGIKFKNTGADSGNYVFIDDVRLSWEWATEAYDPSPADGADEVDGDVVLSWKPGLWAADTNGHEVYFGTAWAEVNNADTSDSTGIYRGPRNRDANTYSPPESPLRLVTTYYWRVDEVNESYAGVDPPPPPDGRWKGQIWSFEVEGRAKNPSPADGAMNVSPLVDLSWTAGVDANSHDVYFGSSFAEVNDANTSSAAYQANQLLSDVNYGPGLLEFDTTYYWRIDEVNLAAEPNRYKGHVWSFTTANYIVVDDFDSYPDYWLLVSVWDDYWVNNTGAEIFLETDLLCIEDKLDV